MNVAILHFHLRRGGVTSVMFKQAAALSSVVQPPHVVFLAGTAPEVPSPAPVHVVPELDYDSFTGREGLAPDEGVSELAAALQRALAVAFPTGCDLLHVHNSLLAKNRRLLGALARLQRQGQALLVHVHDLAEDFRPDVYDGFWPYPEGCHYAVINRRDHSHLIAAGLDPAQVHFLPNPVGASESFEPRDSFAVEAARDRTTALYPVRAIRRKNLGEALLLSRFLPEGAQLAVTLPPTSTKDGARYQAWKSLAGDHGYRIRFEAGLSNPLNRLFEQSFCVVTTSVKEGFGYSYFDPLVRGVPVVGREIPHLAADFAEKGLVFDGLYRQIAVPLASVPVEGLHRAVDGHLTAFRRAYGAVWGPERADQFEALLWELSRRFTGETLDFGALDERLQTTLLSRMETDAGFAQEILRLNPRLASLFTKTPPRETSRALRETVLSEYAEKSYGELLAATYEKALTVPARGRVDKAALLARYLEPGSFFLVAS